MKKIIYLAISLTILPFFSNLSYANNPVEGFQISLQEYEDSIKNIKESLQGLQNIKDSQMILTKLEHQNINFLVYNLKEFIIANQALLDFDKNILKSFNGNYTRYNKKTPSQKEIFKLKGDISYNLTNAIADFSRRRNSKEYNEIITALNNLNKSFNRLKNALIVRTGNKNRMLETSGVHSILKEINNLNYSLETYKLDTGYNLHSIRNTYNLLNGEELMRSSNHGWAGPYADYRISRYPGILYHNKFNLIAFYKVNNRKWSNPQTSKASCGLLDKDCAVFTCFAKMPEIAKINLDLKLDTDQTPDSGNFRYMNNGIACIKQIKYNK